MKKTFMNLVAVLVLSLYLVGLGVAGYYTLQQPPAAASMPVIVSFFVTGATTVLIANLGALLGLRLARGDWGSTGDPADRLDDADRHPPGGARSASGDGG